MSKNKFKKLALVVATVTVPALNLSGCVTIKNYYQEFFGMDKSTREVTGYYEHLDTKIYRNNIVIPQSLDNPGTNTELVLPKIDTKTLHGPLGEKMDVRPPTSPFRSDIGCRSQWSGGEAIVWFENDGSHGVHSEDDAWMLLSAVLKHMDVAVGKIANGQYVLTTIARDFTEYATPYTDADNELGLRRYTQIYQIRVGRNSDNEIGIATKLMASNTKLSSGSKMKDKLDLIEQERFAMGFSNNIIHEIDTKNLQSSFDPDNLVVSLGKDDNNHDAIVVEAPFETTMSLLKELFPKCGWKVTKYSVAKAEFDIEVLDSSDDWIKFRNVTPLNIQKGIYKIRLGIHGNSSAITLYDEKDNPVKSSVVSNLYPGFADILIENFKEYSGVESTKVVAK